MDHRFVGIPELTDVPRVAVVVDVMRAFTVAAWAFSRGAEKIVLASSDGEALALKESRSGWLALKDGAPAAGFDTVNSPGLIRSLDLVGRTVVQKTTAGTVGALAVASAPLVLCASFVVAGATARFLKTEGSGPVTFVVTGDAGQATEDLACAEYIGQHLAGGDVDVAPYLHRARTWGAVNERRTNRHVAECDEVRGGFTVGVRALVGGRTVTGPRHPGCPAPSPWPVTGPFTVTRSAQRAAGPGATAGPAS
ncbi:2-phosphosulfolactate phosphatase [Streptomyces sp. NRRL S-1868]|uniref:2-phosphosulfolactate phosphatase n=1 Tax=Streptomyces sp. NRRL S-1868 TaxID=1463892 RepID=UPI00099D485F|nr:2-phosphosulfolactate phosphatase [Streptomyces sp. NRRL S-1868]